MTLSTLKYKPNFKKRILATLLDYALFWMVVIAYILYFGSDNGEGVTEVSGFSASPIFIFWLIYFVAIEASLSGSFGHQAMGLKILTLSRRPISFMQAFKRRLLDFVDLMMFSGLIAVIVINNSDRKQRVGDMWAQTIVVDTNDPEQYID